MDHKQMTQSELEAVVDRAWTAVGGVSHKRGVWTHTKTGNLYIPLTISLRESDLTPEVVYYRMGNAFVCFARPLAEFLEKFKRVDSDERNDR